MKTKFTFFLLLLSFGIFFGQEQKIFDFVASSAWISIPITISYSMLTSVSISSEAGLSDPYTGSDLRKPMRP